MSSRPELTGYNSTANPCVCLFPLMHRSRAKMQQDSVRLMNLHPSDFELLDLAAVRTFARSVTVYALASHEVRDESPLVAMLRY